MPKKGLIPRRFYWALPVADPDAVHEWENQEQPAMFWEYDMSGNERWVWLGLDGATNWPARWVGEEIASPYPTPDPVIAL